ncbi:deoxyribodipyrimidine photo-lyase [Methanospirillum sp.]|nr:deoxyribodipyrimidine photo-lyase [Methanospirillum sp.]HOL40932.1 deoxyribodipyrimidine photo-lyase [Methanospirillum sp.]HPP79117.1 deoxyribodipyrimidine photo-lyase [Methanospirillum sp.]
MIQPERITSFNVQEPKGSYILYWMQSAVRSRYNHALEYAIEISNDLKKPLIVVFCLDRSYPEATPVHYRFLWEGLQDVNRSLSGRGIGFQILSGSPVDIIPRIADDACMIVTDQGWTRLQREWRQKVIDAAPCKVVIVETNLIVPVQVASPKEEWSAGTFRPKITRQLPAFLHPLAPRHVLVKSTDYQPCTDIPVGAEQQFTQKRINDDSSSHTLPGGETAAEHYLSAFLSGTIDRYEATHNDPTAHATSYLSAYVHFGHISPLEIALRAMERPGPGTHAFLEQLIVRRELSHNFVWYNPWYDRYEGLPEWTRKTLGKHRIDTREYSYNLADFEQCKTHDRAWNAMQHSMIRTGYLHGYLRMYWGKKIIEWTETPEEAYHIALLLNNRYELDGRDPNGFCGVAWCFGKHDRPWKERPVFGTIRYMNEAGLRRKFRLDGWVDRILEEYS